MIDLKFRVSKFILNEGSEGQGGSMQFPLLVQLRSLEFVD